MKLRIINEYGVELQEEGEREDRRERRNRKERERDLERERGRERKERERERTRGWAYTEAITILTDEVAALGVFMFLKK
jgi:hypothetical protein